MLLIGLIGSLLFLVYSVKSQGYESQQQIKDSYLLNPTADGSVLNITYVEKRPTNKEDGAALYK
jgi:hypothetical protein